jgi:hypothetical protein
MKTIPLARFPNWESRLHAHLETRRDWSFKWGKHDCATFIAGCVTAMTGVDVYADFRGIYDSEESSKAALESAGAKTLHRTVAKWLGKSKPIASAHRGDVVMKDNFTLGICLGRWSYFVGREAHEDGLVAVPTADCKRAFSVPYTFQDGSMATPPSLEEAS